MLLASIPSPSVNVFHLGRLTIHMYGILVALGVLVAVVVTERRYRARGGDPALAEKAGMWAVGLGFLGARTAYVSTHLYRFADAWWRVIAIWEGGLALFGGLTVGGLTAVIYLRRHGGNVPAFADAAAVGIPLAQAIGRWGNYFNQELFGTPSNLPWAVRIAPQFRPVEYAQFPTFHPTFLYEFLWNLLLVVPLLLLLDRRRRLLPGNLAFVYFAAYGVGRFLLELMRTDTTFRLFGLSRNGWVSALVVVGSIIVIVVRERRAREAETVETTPSTASLEPPGGEG